MNPTSRSPRPHQAFTLIELLIVIAIIGILMSLLFPAVNSAIDAARKAQAKNDAVQIATAITAYETEYGYLPTRPTSDVTIPAAASAAGDIISILANLNSPNADNPRGIVFIEVNDVTNKKGKSGLRGGNFVDPWGNPYQITLDGGYNNRVTVTAGKLTASGSDTLTDLIKKVAVFNFANSSDKSRDPTHFRKAVRSWE